MEQGVAIALSPSPPAGTVYACWERSAAGSILKRCLLPQVVITREGEDVYTRCQCIGAAVDHQVENGSGRATVRGGVPSNIKYATNLPSRGTTNEKFNILVYVEAGEAEGIDSAGRGQD